jgi:hypothetical protein
MWIPFLEEKEISMQSWKETIFFPVFSSPLSTLISSYFSPPPPLVTRPPLATVKDLPCNNGNDTSLSSLPSKQVCSSFCHLETCHNHVYAEILHANDTFFLNLVGWIRFYLNPKVWAESSTALKNFQKNIQEGFQNISYFLA